MSTAERGIDRATRRARRFLVELGDEIKRGRAELGISQANLGTTVGVSQSLIARIEAGRLGSLSLVTAARLLAPIGRDLSVRVYRGGSPMRDAGQLALLERIRARIPPGLRFRTEVPLLLPGDQRAWDAVVDGPGITAAWECFTRLGDAQATERSINLKQRDSAIPCAVLVLKDSRHNRAAVRAAPGLARTFPSTSRTVFTALRWETAEPERSDLPVATWSTSGRERRTPTTGSSGEATTRFGCSIAGSSGGSGWNAGRQFCRSKSALHAVKPTRSPRCALRRRGSGTRARQSLPDLATPRSGRCKLRTSSSGSSDTARSGPTG